MAYEEIISNLPQGMEGMVASGFLGAIIALGILITLIFGLAFYIYHSLAWMTIAKKKKYRNSWLAWIPFASSAMRLQLGGFHWAWVFLYLVPVAGWIAIFTLLIISHWRIFESLKYPGWLSLAPLIVLIPILSGFGMLAYLVVIGIVAWGKK